MTYMSDQGRKALERVAEWLEAGAPHVGLENGLQVDRFDMEHAVSVRTDCGTSCCIAGAVCQFEGLGLEYRYGDGSLFWCGSTGAETLAGDFLGLTEDARMQLFCPWEEFAGESHTFNSPARGAAVIRHFLATGDVEWDRIDDQGIYYGD